MTSAIVAFLPIGWAILATTIGLVLFKSSKAFYESRVGDKNRQRRLRHRGSVTIAAVAFCGMWYATDQGLKRYSADRQEELQKRVVEIDQLVFRIQGCITVDQHRCTGEAQELFMKSAELRTFVGATPPPVAAK